MATAPITDDSDFFSNLADVGLDIFGQVAPVIITDYFIDKPAPKTVTIATPPATTTQQPSPSTTPTRPPPEEKKGMDTTTMVLIGVGALVVVGGGLFLFMR